MGKVYLGHRVPQHGPTVVTVEDNGAVRALPARHDIRNHSPDGFEWGYLGSGPAQLALAILADCLSNDQLAAMYYQQFKREVVCNLDGASWMLTEDRISSWVQHTTKERRG